MQMGAAGAGASSRAWLPGRGTGGPGQEMRGGSRRGNFSNRSDCHTLARLLRIARRVLYLQQQLASPSASAGQSSLCDSIFPGCLC